MPMMPQPYDIFILALYRNWIYSQVIDSRIQSDTSGLRDQRRRYWATAIGGSGTSSCCLIFACICSEVQRRSLNHTSGSKRGLDRARRISLIVTALITATFIICWGPYYVTGLAEWFDAGQGGIKLSSTVSVSNEMKFHFRHSVSFRLWIAISFILPFRREISWWCQSIWIPCCTRWLLYGW